MSSAALGEPHYGPHSLAAAERGAGYIPLVLRREYDVTAKWKCNVCGTIHNSFSQACYCHPDVVPFYKGLSPDRAAEQRNEAEQGAAGSGPEKEAAFNRRLFTVVAVHYLAAHMRAAHGSIEAAREEALQKRARTGLDYIVIEVLP
jgi:hypothetical protein